MRAAEHARARQSTQSRGRRALRIGCQAVIVAAVLALWVVTLRPASLGGPTTYAVVHGESMLPDYRNGDLVVLHSGTRLGAGDVVAYRVPAAEVGAGELVIHRIVSADPSGALTLRGDHNGAPDPWHPGPGDVVGRAWLRVPYVGRGLVVLRQPLVLADLALALFSGWLVAHRRPGKPPRPGAVGEGGRAPARFGLRHRPGGQTPTR